MNIWNLEEDTFDPEKIVTNGNRFLQGNGYMGCRGTMPEWGSKELAAVNLAGVYDQNGDKWREPVNAPNGLFAKVFFDGVPMALGETECLRHRQSLCFRDGVFRRETEFEAVTLKAERFVSMDDPHRMAMQITVIPKRDGELVIKTGISRDIWDINGPHLFDFESTAAEVLHLLCRTGQLHIPVSVYQAAQLHFDAEQTQSAVEDGVFRQIRIAAKAGEPYTMDVFVHVSTGLDEDYRPETPEIPPSFDQLRSAHQAAWEAVWHSCEIQLRGCDEAALALNASLYHLNSIAPRHAKALSVPARGLSGQTYKGAVFWDSEIFIFPVFVHTQPGLAKTLLRYRIDTLPGAKKKAAEYGFRGAFYAWESQEGGAEGCTNYNVTDVFTHRPVRTYFRDKQIHISGDIAYAFWRYYEITGDAGLLKEGGAEVILECARFYLSRAHMRLDSGKVELLDVIGPDEYHERVNNNAFTNRMAVSCMQAALKLPQVLGEDSWKALAEKLDYGADFALLKKYAQKLLEDFPEGEIIEQFDGYFGLEDCSVQTVRSRVLDPKEYWGTNRGVAAHTQVIKQADVIAMMALFPGDFSEETVAKNWAFYEPRTEHGSSLSACMYALTACRIHRPDLAWEHFRKSASIDLTGGGKEWAGEIYIGGTHPAANGGAWMIAVLGFAGVHVENGVLSLEPNLPKQIQLLRFPIAVGERKYLVSVTQEGWTAEEK